LHKLQFFSKFKQKGQRNVIMLTLDVGFSVPLAYILIWFGAYMVMTQQEETPPPKKKAGDM